MQEPFPNQILRLRTQKTGVKGGKGSIEWDTPVVSSSGVTRGTVACDVWQCYSLQGVTLRDISWPASQLTHTHQSRAGQLGPKDGDSGSRDSVSEGLGQEPGEDHNSFSTDSV